MGTERGAQAASNSGLPSSNVRPIEGAVPGREQLPSEEMANSISHFVGFVAAALASPILLSRAMAKGDTGLIVGVSVFAAAMLLLYLASAVFHALPAGRAKQFVCTLEHSAIFVLIAGTYTPFALGVLRGAIGWTLFVLVWAIAAIGIALKVFPAAFPRVFSHPIASTGLYLCMGWLIVIAINPVLANMQPGGVGWLVAGGCAYTVGVAFFVAGVRVRFAHFVWHLFVMAGTSCHFLAVFWYASSL